MTVFRVTRKTSTNEWVVVVTVNGVRNENRCYYTNDKKDAFDTREAMEKEEKRLNPMK